MMKMRVLCAVGVAIAACDQKTQAPALPTRVTVAVPADASASVTTPEFNRLGRTEFNQRAQERFTPLFWRTDANNNATLDPDELVILVGPFGLKRADFVDANGFTKLFAQTYDALTVPLDFSKLDPVEKGRRELTLLELSQGMPTLVETDFSKSSDQDRAIIAHLQKAAGLIETLHGKQTGSDALKSQLVTNDPSSQAVFYRNQGPWCAAPKTENDADCSALVGKPARVYGLYPADVQTSPAFCEKLSKEKNAKALMEHFSTVVADGKGFKPVPYSAAYPVEMQAVAAELTAAAAAITSDDEAAFKAYLVAAAHAFTTNDWESANPAWVAMGPTNSKWYLRIAPDEVYFEPCAWKAGFAIQVARINLDSLEWQKKLEPVKADMEKALAVMAGPPYKAREVKFKLPDFIDVVLNGGDARNPSGATLGESLPNWGPTAEKGGRTVAMTNLYTDADSVSVLKDQAASLLCANTFARFDADNRFSTMATVLHEAAHNLGPAHDYRVKGKKEDELFGGTLASTLEELKAQTSSMFFTDWLAAKGVISPDDAAHTHLRDVTWAFGHISRGMYDGGNKPKTYSQLASIQMGTFFKANVLQWQKDEKAANGTDVGCFEVDAAGLKGSIDALTKRVLGIKGTGNLKDAQAIKAEFVDASDGWAELRGVIATRWLRAPKAAFVYSITP